MAKEIELEEPFQNMGAKMINQVAKKTADAAGDGNPDVVFVANTGGAAEEVTLPPGDWVRWVDTATDLIEPAAVGPTVTAQPYTILVLAQS
mgnify:CR=1 FL=1